MSAGVADWVPAATASATQAWDQLAPLDIVGQNVRELQQAGND
jgi:hypothetical protein